MLSRAMNYLKRKRNDKEGKGQPIHGETSQAIVPYVSEVGVAPMSFNLHVTHTYPCI